MTILPDNKKYNGNICWATALAFFAIFSIAAWKPLHLDSMDLPALAEAISKTGLSVYYRGEQYPQASGLYHPPLYIYVLAFWFKIFGIGAAQARMLGGVCALLQGLCALQILRQVFGSKYVRSISVWFWPLFALNAYTIQTAAIPDIDSSIYGPLLCLLLLTILRLMWRDGVWRTEAAKAVEYIYPALVLTACLWAKLTTIWLALPFVFVLLIARFGWLRAACVSVSLSAGGIGFFLFSYWIFGLATHQSISFTFSFIWACLWNCGSGGSAGVIGWAADRWQNLSVTIPFTVRWTGLVPWLACGIAACIGTWRGLRMGDRRALHGALILWLASLTAAYYCGQTRAFGAAPFKYIYVYWAIAICGLVATVLPPRADWQAISAPPTRAWALSWCVAAATGLLLVKDRTLTAIYGSEAIHWPILIPAALLLIGLLLRLIGRESVSQLGLAATLVLYGGFQAGMAVYQNAQDYSTTYDYGQRGFIDTVGFVRTHTESDDIVVSMKDIGYAARRRYFENYAAVYGDLAQTATMQDLLRSGRAKFAIFTEEHGQDQLVMNPPLRDWVLQNCRLTASFGNYRIYQYASDQRQPIPQPAPAR